MKGFCGICCRVYDGRTVYLRIFYGVGVFGRFFEEEVR